MVRLLAILAVLSLAVASFGSTAEYSASDLVGVWRLIHSEDPMPNGTIVPYCNGVHGYVIYTPDGHVSVALNCGPRANKFEPADVSGRMFFYTGTYEVNGTSVTHYIENASDTQLIGKSVTRNIALHGYTLELSGLSQGQKFSATWQNTAIAVATRSFGHAVALDSACDAKGSAYKFAEQYLARLKDIPVAA